MMREGIPKRRASMSKTTRGKSNVDIRSGEEIEEAEWSWCVGVKDVVKMRSIEGQRCGVNGTRVANLKLIRCWIGCQWSEFRAEVVLVVEQVTTRAKEFWTRWRRWILREEMLVRMELTISNLEPTIAQWYSQEQLELLMTTHEYL